MANQFHPGNGYDITYTFNGLIDTSTPVKVIMAPDGLATATLHAFDASNDTLMVSIDHNDAAGKFTVQIQVDPDLSVTGVATLMSDPLDFEALPAGATAVSASVSAERPTPPPAP